MKKYSMSRFSSSSKMFITIAILAVLLLSGCNRTKEVTPQISVCDYYAFKTTSTDFEAAMDELYVYICRNSQVDNLPEADVNNMADSIKAFYTKLVEQKLSEYNEKGHDASFEEMLKFLFQLDSKEALAAYAQAYAKAEVKNRIVIRAIATDIGVHVTETEFAEEKDKLEISSLMGGDSDEEIRYELLRRKVLRAILETTEK